MRKDLLILVGGAGAVVPALPTCDPNALVAQGGNFMFKCHGMILIEINQAEERCSKYFSFRGDPSDDQYIVSAASRAFAGRCIDVSGDGNTHEDFEPTAFKDGQNVGITCKKNGHTFIYSVPKAENGLINPLVEKSSNIGNLSL